MSQRGGMIGRERESAREKKNESQKGEYGEDKEKKGLRILVIIITYKTQKSLGPMMHTINCQSSLYFTG